MGILQEGEILLVAETEVEVKEEGRYVAGSIRSGWKKQVRGIVLTKKGGELFVARVLGAGSVSMTDGIPVSPQLFNDILLQREKPGALYPALAERVMNVVGRQSAYSYGRYGKGGYELEVQVRTKKPDIVLIGRTGCFKGNVEKAVGLQRVGSNFLVCGKSDNAFVGVPDLAAAGEKVLSVDEKTISALFRHKCTRIGRLLTSEQCDIVQGLLAQP